MTLLTSRGVPTARRSLPVSGIEPDVRVPDASREPSGRHRRPRRLARWWRGVVRQARRSADSGMATAEYAIVTVAAAAFAGLLIVVLRSDEVRGLLVGIIRGALSM